MLFAERGALPSAAPSLQVTPSRLQAAPVSSALATLPPVRAEGRDVEVSQPSERKGIGASIIHWLEDRVAAVANDTWLGKACWAVRDFAVNAAFEKLGVRPQYSYRGQSGLPMSEVRASERDLKEITQLASGSHPTLSAFTGMLQELLPRVPLNNPHGEPGIWCHLKRSYPFDSPHLQRAQELSRSRGAESCRDFLQELCRIMRDDMDVVMRVPIPNDTVIKRGLNHNLSFMVSDIGNEMIIPLREVFPEDFSARAPSQKADLVNAMVHYIRGDEGYRVPTTAERETIAKVVAFRDIAYDLITRHAGRIEAVNDPDVVKRILDDLTSELHAVATHEGLVDPKRFPLSFESAPSSHVTLSGERLFDSKRWASEASYYWTVADDFKKDLVSGKLAPDITARLDSDRPYTVHLLPARKCETNLLIFPIEFRQGETRFSAVLEVTRAPANPDAPYRWQCYGASAGSSEPS